MIKVNAIAVSCDQQYCRLYCLDFYNFFIVLCSYITNMQDAFLPHGV